MLFHVKNTVTQCDSAFRHLYGPDTEVNYIMPIPITRQLHILIPIRPKYTNSIPFIRYKFQQAMSC